MFDIAVEEETAGIGFELLHPRVVHNIRWMCNGSSMILIQETSRAKVELRRLSLSRVFLSHSFNFSGEEREGVCVSFPIKIQKCSTLKSLVYNKKNTCTLSDLLN